MEVKTKIYKIMDYDGVRTFLNEKDFYNYVFESAAMKGKFTSLMEMRDWFHNNVVVEE